MARLLPPTGRVTAFHSPEVGMVTLRRGARVRCSRPDGPHTTLRVRALPDKKVALLDARGAAIAVLAPLEVGRLRGALRDATIRALRPEWDGRTESAGWPFA